ncbi:MAG: winged helix-turn-helix transcriptional regulator [Anaerolineales bacterium]|nr:winged helix-turn-helix transcriptional regulator [Anaerolineales bacterium]
MDPNIETRELILLEQIEDDPDVSQASLAAQLGVAVGTVNWHLKRLVAKGYVKVKRAQRRKLRYIITPDGISFRARLTINYVENQLRLYRNTRERVKKFLSEVKQEGYKDVRLVGNGDIAEICRLTCLEAGINIEDAPNIPTLEIQGWKVYLTWSEPHD